MVQKLSFETEKIRAQERSQAFQALLPLAAINRLPQMRETFDTLEELKTSIAQKGQIAPGVAAVLTPHQAKDYIDAINAIRHAHRSIDEMTRIHLDGKPRYVILIAGERRFRGCVELEEEHPGKGPIGAYKRKYWVTLCVGISVDEALELQLQENLHKPVPPVEAAAYTRDLYAWRKAAHPQLSLAQFSKDISRSDGWVRDALRFCELPLSIQALAKEQGPVKVPFQMLVKLERFAFRMRTEAQTILSEQDLLSHVHVALARQMNAKKFGEHLQRLLEAKTGGQGELFSVQEAVPLSRADTEETLFRGLVGFKSYVRMVETLRARGAFGSSSYIEPRQGGAVGSDTSLTLLGDLGEIFQEVEAHTRNLAGRTARKMAKAVPAADSVARNARQLVASSK